MTGTFHPRAWYLSAVPADQGMRAQCMNTSTNGTSVKRTKRMCPTAVEECHPREVPDF